MLKDYLLNERVDKKITLDVFSKLYIDLIYGSPDDKSDILKNIITDHCKTKLTKPLVIHVSIKKKMMLGLNTPQYFISISYL